MKKTILIPTILTAILGCTETKNDVNRKNPTTVIVAATSRYVLQGDTFRVQVVPVNSGQWNNQISFENTGVQVTESHWENGVLKVSIKADEQGLSKFSGKFRFKTADADTTILFSSEFMVAKPSISIKTNTLIKDIENPIEIGIPGILPSFGLTAEGAEIKGDFGRYTITPHITGSLKMNVKSKDGKTDYGNYEFEVFEKK